jgi:Tfp pilus assembly protein PilF
MKPSLNTLRAFGIFASLLLAGCGSPEQRSQGYYERGMELLAKGDDLNARVQLTTSLKFKSDRIEAWRALAGVDERTKTLPQLFQDLRRIVELDPSDLDARVKLARMMVSGGASDAALKIIEAANEGDKPSAELHALKALLLFKSKDPAGAMREAQRALEIDSKNVEASLLVASQKASDGDADDALKLLNNLQPEKPDEKLRVGLEKAQILAHKKDLPQAELLLKSLIGENPGTAKTLRNDLVQLYVLGKQFDDAERELRTAANADPSDSKAEMNLVRFLSSAKGPNAAREELVSRIAAGGDTFAYQMALADFDFSEGKVAEATQSLQKLVSATPNPDLQSQAKVKLAEVYAKQANYSAADPLIAEVLKSDSRNTGALRIRAGIRIERGQIDGAVEDLREALNDQPKSVDLLTSLALAYERGGKNELAERQYADALKASAQNPNVALRYVSFLQRHGRCFDGCGWA